MHPVFEVESKVRAYVSRGIGLGDLRRWFNAARGPLFELPPQLPAVELATVIELGLIELRQGGFSERQFRSLLKRETENTPHLTIEGNPDFTLSDSITTDATARVSASGGDSSTVLQETLVDTSP